MIEAVVALAIVASLILLLSANAEGKIHSERTGWDVEPAVWKFEDYAAEASAAEAPILGLKLEILYARVESNYREAVLVIRDHHFAAWQEEVRIFRSRAQARASRARSQTSRLLSASKRARLRRATAGTAVLAVSNYREQTRYQLVADLGDDLAWAEALYQSAVSNLTVLAPGRVSG